ncbi:MAG: c-type cytochrome biogenesis protein CcsB [Candidatus Eremiobacteraeota bacterium]|nr:c-type cytochrome biogenesis protein CcsB [Candidatus Eremiobacteraeota bacterium]
MPQSIKMHPLEPLSFQAFFGLYFLSLVAYLFYAFTKRESAGKAATALLVLGLLANTVNLVARGIEAGRVPFANLYESLLIFIWGIALCLLWCTLRWRIHLAGALVMPLVFAMACFALTVDSEIEPLMPALRSNWITYHVATAIVAYGAFAYSFALAVIYLIREHMEKDGSSSPLLERLPGLEKLDRLIYKVIAFGFPFLVLLIITGAIWAERAWGRYWSWDPKETWSLITMFIYAGFLHARFFLKWRGRTTALFAIIGFASVVFCYLGVNLLLPGLHSYGRR